MQTFYLGLLEHHFSDYGSWTSSVLLTLFDAFFLWGVVVGGVGVVVVGVWGEVFKRCSICLHSQTCTFIKRVFYKCKEIDKLNLDL